jgi:2-aminoethylphosphonate dioxygenase
MDSDGYILLKDFFSKLEARYIRNWANEMNEFKEEKGKWMIYFEDNKLRSRIENFSNYNAHLKNFMNTRIKLKIEEIIGEKIILFKEKMNWKYPKGKGFLAHQDQPAWSDFPPSIYYTAAIFADDTTVENGCLQFVEGFNKKHIIAYDAEGSGKLLDEDKMNWEHVETTSRDLLIFNSFVPHRSDQNISDGSRRIFYFTYNLLKEGDYFDLYLKKKRKELPPPIERDPNKEYKIKGSKYNLANPIN